MSQILCKTREEYLTKAVNYFRKQLFARQGADVPVVRVSVGFPAGSRPTGKNKKIGQYWDAKSTNDGIGQVFISPELADPIEALATLAHELVHAVHPDDGHGSKFKALATRIGLIGPASETAPGDALKEELQALATALGEYPHGAINLASRRKQETHLKKCSCKLCGYIAYTTLKWINAHGAPLCPCNPMGPSPMIQTS